jgi:hypothetical protein
MGNYCEDCGCRTSSGVCSNCQEELYIMNEQSEFLGPLSDDFVSKAEDQKQLIEDRKER